MADATAAASSAAARRGQWVVTAVAAACAVGGASLQTVALVRWQSSPDLSSFGVILVSTAYFALAFAAIIGVRAVAAGGDWRMFLVSHDPEENVLLRWPVRGQGWSMAQLVCACGLLASLNSYLNVYAAPPSRTPPLVQSVLLNTGVLFAVPLSKAMLGDNKRYCAPRPVIAATLIALSVVVSLLPSVLSDGSLPPPDVELGGGVGGAARALAGRLLAASPSATLGWASLYLLANLPWAADCVVEQAFMMRAGAHEEGYSNSDLATVTLRMLFWQALWVLVFLFVFAWVDLIPGFGFSDSPADFAHNTLHAVVCSVVGRDAAARVSGKPLDTCPALAPLWAAAMSAGFVVAYIGDAVLIRVSASLSMLNYVLITGVTSAIFLVPGVNPAPEGTPLYSVGACTKRHRLTPCIHAVNPPPRPLIVS